MASSITDSTRDGIGCSEHTRESGFLERTKIEGVALGDSPPANSKESNSMYRL